MLLRQIAHRLISLVILFIAGTTLPAFSQADSGSKTPPWLNLNFEHRTRFEQLTHPFRSNPSITEKYVSLRTRLRLEIGEVNRPVRFLLEFQDSRVLNHAERLHSSRSSINEHDFLQGYLELNPVDFPLKASRSQILAGRFTMDLGKRRLAARNNTRNTTNTFDGVSWSIAGDWEWTIRTFFTRPVDIDSYRLDTPGHRYFWGTYFASKHYPSMFVDFYYLGLYDTQESAGQQKLSTLGGRLYRLPASGSMDYEIESAWQFGRSGPLDHSAYFFHGELGFSPSAFWNPRISLHYDYASGDANPEDYRSGRFNPLYGARGFEFPITGIYGPIYRSNIDSPGIRMAFHPARSLQLVTSYRRLKLAEARDAWIGSGLQDTEGRSGKSIGQNFEARAQWRTNRYMSVEMGYTQLFKGSYLNQAADRNFPGNSNYFYIAAEFKAKLLPY